MNVETKLVIKVALGLLPIFALVIRLLVILPCLQDETSRKALDVLPPQSEGSSVMVLLGSGGHTGEMIRILGNVQLAHFNRIWVTSSGDSTSLLKCKDYESSIGENQYNATFMTLHRARSVGEPLISSIKSTVTSFGSTVKQLASLPELPSVLLINGPGTCVPLAYILFGMKFFGLCQTRIVYIESLARVNSLSLSGKLVLPVADRFLVQWEPLSHQYKRVEYHGILI
ncbi:UDP-N-acetylglucosamine transferase subunit Alg14p [[Candida] anglica]|uniref:UDP-N-acetylglucosamine transferase subunit ALG14 n=1 Tax=[Candida] anglica TaxID=148631 RepID=A0ABP0EEA7_9ASCO